MELIFDRKKRENRAKLEQTNRAIWGTVAIWLVGVCLFLIFSTRQNGLGRWGCTALTVLAFAVVTYLFGLRRKEAKAGLALFEKLDEGSVYREYLIFDEALKPELVSGVLLVPCRFFEASGGDRKIYLPPQGEIAAQKGRQVTVENTAGIVVSCKDKESGKELLSISTEEEKPASVKTFLTRFAFVLLGGTVASIMLIGLLFSLLHSPKDSESVYVFFAGKVQDYSFERKAVKEIGDAGVKLVEISSAMPGDTAFMQKYSVVGLTSCNIIIVPLEIAGQTSVKYTDFEEFCGGVEIPSSISSKVKYYTRDGKNAGIYVEGALREKLGKFFEFDDSAYVMFVTTAGFGAEKGAEGYAVGKVMEWLFAD